MSNVQQIEHIFKENFCELTLNLKKSPENHTGVQCGPGRHVQNIRNCDLFIEDYNLLIYLDVQLYKFRNTRRFDMKDIKNVEINYNTKEQCMFLSLPCLPDNDEELQDSTEKSTEEKKSKDNKKSLDLWKLKRITDQCYIRVDNAKELLKPESNFDYGFASKFRGTIRRFDCDLEIITRMPEPDSVSPLQRTIDREIDEMKNFSRDQYKLNFVELQVPDGLDNPMQFSINFKDSTLSQDEQMLLHNLTCKPELMEMPDEYDIMEIDCGLISILLGICYDVRFTSNEANCESAWTRSILSATLSYFEPFTSLKDVVISFMRRSLIYPLYRNYELSKQCIEDCITALQMNSAWILKQLLICREIFETNERTVFNYYYIDDYIRYLSNPTLCSANHLQMLAHNLKNVLYDIFKKHLGLGLQELETELLKELITDIHIAASNSEDDSEDHDCDDDDSDDDDDDDEETTDDVGTESCESEFCNLPNKQSDNSSSSSSDTEEDSVIEQKMDNLKFILTNITEI
ncbi:SHQ1-like protein [Lucilia cuprina]|uniref:Protein SHQ1 homolog n=1 Tax=Lucilia cuprina TaxID=7375 RepID=A0A0L0CE82_LUCCU|nr:SHQ1-like protein [Lucilia cuprina]